MAFKIGLLDESSFKGTGFDTGHYPMAAVFGWRYSK
jgi:hypothetical protein